MKKFKKLMSVQVLPALFAFALVMLSAFGSEAQSTTQTREISGFNGLSIDGAFDVTLIQGNTENVTIEADASVIDKITTTKSGNTLKISCKGDIRTKDDMKLTVRFKNIGEIEASGSVNIHSESTINANHFEMSLSGASKSKLALNSEEIEVDISGAAEIIFDGKAKSVEVNISGSGDYRAAKLVSGKYEINISGAGVAEVFPESELEVSISGTGVVKYKGDPKVSQSITGMGKLVRL